MRNKVLSKEKLIEIAEFIIKEEGLESCTARNIAKHANCALGTIYNYFDSRDAFLEQVFSHSWQITKTKLLEIVESELELKDKAINVFRVINEDVNNRSGLGKYLFVNVSVAVDGECRANIVKKSGLDVIINLLKQSIRNSHVAEDEIKIAAEWIYFGVIAINLQEEDMEKYFKIVMERFF
ncbi:MAG: TetR/AcrR family transcriptional regulator [Tenericutes bacterium]|nr:TetR/AcrR family transcriptional regulator [Mycoplasmatota bacterium]